MLDTVIIIASLLLLPAFIWMMVVGLRVRKIFNKYNSIPSSTMVTAYTMARKILDDAGLNSVDIAMTSGSLTDHFNPKDNTVYLSETTYKSYSVAALGIAAHEVGHAIQFNDGYAPLKLRTASAPIIMITSRFAFPLIFIGLILEIFMYTTEFASYMIMAGVIFYGFYTLFTLITLPVEYNASSRAKKFLYSSGILTQEEVKMSAEVLSAAAKTYLAAFIVSLLQFLRFLPLLLGRRR